MKTLFQNTHLRISLLFVSLLFVLLMLPSTAFAQERQTIRLALDWLPNTNHTGIYVAQAQGWYEEAGISLDILPFSGVMAEISVSSGQADVAVSSTENVLAAAASGDPVIAIATMLATNTAAFAVLASSDIDSPADFADKLYAAFGASYEEPILRTLIEADGGTGNVESVILNVSGFDALLSGFADIVWIFEGWQGVQAELEAIDLRLFNFTDYGLPDYYTPVLATSPEALEQMPDQLQAFIDATTRGYTFAANNPEQAAELLLENTPAGTFPNEELVRRSQAFVSQYYLSEGNPWGYQDPAKWQGYPNLLLEAAVFSDTAGNPVTDIDTSTLFTNMFIDIE